MVFALFDHESRKSHQETDAMQDMMRFVFDLPVVGMWNTIEGKCHWT